MQPGVLLINAIALLANWLSTALMGCFIAPPPDYANRPSSAKDFALADQLPQATLLKTKPAAIVVGKTTITIRLPGKHRRMLKDDLPTVQETEACTYDYVGQLQQLTYYAFHFSLYEDEEYLLVHRQTGAVTHLFGPPLESPKAYYVACRTMWFGIKS